MPLSDAQIQVTIDRLTALLASLNRFKGLVDNKLEVIERLEIDASITEVTAGINQLQAILDAG